MRVLTLFLAFLLTLATTAAAAELEMDVKKAKPVTLTKMPSSPLYPGSERYHADFSKEAGVEAYCVMPSGHGDAKLMIFDKILDSSYVVTVNRERMEGKIAVLHRHDFNLKTGKELTEGDPGWMDDKPVSSWYSTMHDKYIELKSSDDDYAGLFGFSLTLALGDNGREYDARVEFLKRFDEVCNTGNSVIELEDASLKTVYTIQYNEINSMVGAIVKRPKNIMANIHN